MPVLRRGPLPLLLLLIGLLLPVGWGAGPPPARAQEPDFPPLTGRVVDRADLLSAAEEAAIGAALARHERETTEQIVVATLESLQGLPVEEYGYQLGRHWAIGQEGEDNGALLIVAPSERAVRIEVGYGLEGRLTDALSRIIIENEILPRFREDDFAGGIEAGVAAMLAALGGTYEVPQQAIYDQGDGRRDEAPGPFALLPALPILMIFLFNLLFRSRGRRGRRGRYGGPILIPGGFGGGGGRRGGFGGGGGGGFGGGGGSFGGGGASGRW
jgi:uncharacterized protein